MDSAHVLSQDEEHGDIRSLVELRQLARAGDDGGVRHARTVVKVEKSVQEGDVWRLTGHVGSETDAVDVFQWVGSAPAQSTKVGRKS